VSLTEWRPPLEASSSRPARRDASPSQPFSLLASRCSNSGGLRAGYILPLLVVLQQMHQTALIHRGVTLEAIFGADSSGRIGSMYQVLDMSHHEPRTSRAASSTLPRTCRCSPELQQRPRNATSQQLTYDEKALPRFTMRPSIMFE
jgi:hypothetical protein